MWGPSLRVGFCAFLHECFSAIKNQVISFLENGYN